jgi:hypothetical protein
MLNGVVSGTTRSVSGSPPALRQAAEPLAGIRTPSPAATSPLVATSLAGRSRSAAGGPARRVQLPVPCPARSSPSSTSTKPGRRVTRSSPAAREGAAVGPSRSGGANRTVSTAAGSGPQTRAVATAPGGNNVGVARADDGRPHHRLPGQHVDGPCGDPQGQPPHLWRRHGHLRAIEPVISTAAHASTSLDHGLAYSRLRHSAPRRFDAIVPWRIRNRLVQIA